MQNHILYQLNKLIFFIKVGVVPRKAAKLEKVVWNLKKNDLCDRKAQERHMVEPNPLHIQHPRNRGPSIV